MAPYNPGLAPALESANNNFMKANTQFDQDMHDAIGQHKQNVQDSANADQTFQMLVPAIKQAGLPLDPDIVAKYGGASLSAKKGMIGALATQYAAALSAQKDQAQIQQYTAQAADRQADAKASSDAGNFLQRYGQNIAPDPDGDPNQPAVSPIEAFNQTLKQMPKDFDVGRALPKAMDAISKFNQMKAGPAGAEDTPIVPQDLGNGRTGYRMPGSKQFEIKDDPTSLESGATPMTAPDGSLLGYNIPKGGGKYNFQPIKEMTDDQKQNLILQHQKATSGLLAMIPGAQGNPDSLKAINDEIATHRNAVTQLQAKAKAPGAPADAPLAMPTDKAQMKKGQAYQTSRGVYTWDGTQFTK
jgi:hypothetical protein